MKQFFFGLLALVSVSAFAETTESCRKSYFESGFIQYHAEQDLRKIILDELTTKFAAMRIEASNIKLFVEVNPGIDQLPVYVTIKAKGEATTQRSKLSIEMLKIQTGIGKIKYGTIRDNEGFPVSDTCLIESTLKFKIINKTNGHQAIGTFQVKSQIEVSPNY